MTKMDKVPEPITVNTGEQETVGETIDNFFFETAEYLERVHRISKSDLEIKSGELSYRLSVISQDRITYLTSRNRIYATVFETRTEFNHVRYTFFRDLSFY